MTVGQRLKIFMGKSGFKQNEFSAQLGIRQNQMSRIINDKGELKHESLTFLITKFGINLNWLFIGEGSIYYQNNNLNPINEPKIEYKTSKGGDFSVKYTQALEKLTEANEKEKAYLKRIMELEHYIKENIKVATKKKA